MIRNRIVSTVLAGVLLAIGGGAPSASVEDSAPNVQWTALAKQDFSDTQAHRATLEISAVVPQGWHVYALNQLPGGPTPLRISIEEGAAAQITGTASGSTPEKRHDPSFDLDTEFYTHAFTLRFAIESQRSLATSRALPVSVRFQLCSERECQPPKTVHLQASIAGAPET